MSSRQATGPAAAAGNGAREGEQTTWQKFMAIAQQALIFWVISQVVTKFFAPAAKGPNPAPVTTPDAQVPGGQAQVDPRSQVPQQLIPSWPLGQPLSMHVYLSTSPNGDVFSKQWTSAYRPNEDQNLPSFVWSDIMFGDWHQTYTTDLLVDIPESVKRNGSLWADVFLVKDGASPDPRHDTFAPESVHHVRKLLTPYLPKTKVIKVKSLLSTSSTNDTETDEPIDEPDIIVPHWHNNVTLALISDQPSVSAQLPVPVVQHVHVLPNVRDPSGTRAYYKPIIFPNDFWRLRSQYIEVNSTTTTLPVQFVFQPMSFFKFQAFATLSQGFEDAAKQQGAGASAEMDEVKRMLVETNPWFLALTGLVSLLHTVFEMLAFKSDVSHWRQRKELVGVSVRTIVTNVVVQIIVLLYLIDNNADTSWMILMGSGIGVIIEAWKITKAVDISIAPSPAGSKLPYMLVIKDKHVLSEDERKTQEYDRLAFRYVSWVVIPCLIIYAGYSLVYETHKGWYSFVISTLTSFVYMFGFAQLVPQLIINYKLKSVAHMPARAMVYKTLSTVVDDLFAFCIKMPFLHRLACFRDDVVFLVFLYQRWIYRIDPKRINEYGQVMENQETVEETKKVDEKGESKKTK